jgi:hypothetical protein
MPLNIEREQLVPLAKARGLFPGSPSRSTLRRYAMSGYRGIKLDSANLPGGRFTSKEAVIRFLKLVAKSGRTV